MKNAQEIFQVLAMFSKAANSILLNYTAQILLNYIYKNTRNIQKNSSMLQNLNSFKFKKTKKNEIKKNFLNFILERYENK